MYPLHAFVGKWMKTLRPHLWAILLALLVGIISGIPQYLSVRALGPDYHGIPLLFQDSEAVYMTRIQEIDDGHGELKSPFLYEYKEGISVMPPTGEYVYFVLSKITSFSISIILVLSKYIFPALLFFLIYLFTLLLLGGAEDTRIWALSAATVVTLGYELVNFREAISIFAGRYESIYLSIWSRAVNPITGGLFLFGYLASVFLLVRGKKYAWILSGILLSVMTGYIFSFGIAVMTALVFIVAALFFGSYRTAGFLTLSVFFAFLINIPRLVFILPGVFSNGGIEEAFKSGLLLTHQPLLSVVLTVTFVILGVGIFYDLYKRRTLLLSSPQLFCFLVLLASVLAMNQHVITGKTVWPQHFVQYTTPLSIISALVAFFIYVRPLFPRLWRTIPIILITISFVFSFFTIPTYVNRLSDYKKINGYSGALSWLKSREGPCVVLPVGEIEQINSYATAFTGCDIYFTHYVFTGIPRDRIIHNELVTMAFQNIPPEESKKYLISHESRVRAVLFRDWKDLFRHSDDPWLSSISDRTEIDEWTGGVIEELSQKYKIFRQKDFRSELLKYRLDYVMDDKEGSVPFDEKLFPFLQKVYEDGKFVIYKII